VIIVNVEWSKTAPLLVLALLFSRPAGADDLLLSVSARDAILRQIILPDVLTVDDSVTITLPESTVTGATGLARDPLTDTLYALLKLQGTSFRVLVTLNESDGEAESLGNTGENLAGIAFTDDGTLYGVSGDGAVTPETLYTVSMEDGSITFAVQLGNGSDGETLAFNPDDGLLYHASGIGTPNSTELFETIDPDNSFAVANVSLSGDDYEELSSLVYGDGGFFAGDVGNINFDDPGLFRITAGGVSTFLGSMDHVSKGLVYLPEPALAPQLLAGIAFLWAVRRRRNPPSEFSPLPAFACGTPRRGYPAPRRPLGSFG
jgi:hypothetical protein